MCCAKCWLTIGAILAGLAVVTGAFAAHGIDRFMAEKYKDEKPYNIAGFEVPTSWKRLQDFKTAADYQMYHAFALVALGLLGETERRKARQLAGWSFLLGIVLFSGSLYVLTLTGQRWLGAITPLGGTLFIVGWFALAYVACPCHSAKNSKPVLPDEPTPWESGIHH